MGFEGSKKATTSTTSSSRGTVEDESASGSSAGSPKISSSSLASRNGHRGSTNSLLSASSNTDRQSSTTGAPNHRFSSFGGFSDEGDGDSMNDDRGLGEDDEGDDILMDIPPQFRKLAPPKTRSGSMIVKRAVQRSESIHCLVVDMVKEEKRIEKFAFDAGERRISKPKIHLNSMWKELNRKASRG